MIFELIHFESFGHPFYQHELALINKKKGIWTIFICPSNYQHHNVLEFIRKDFLIILLNRRIVNFLLKLGLKQNYLIDHKFNYGLFLDKPSLGKFPKFLVEKNNSIDICIFIRSKIKIKDPKYTYSPSARDFEIDYLQDVEDVINEGRLSFIYGSTGLDNKNKISSKEDKVSTIEDIKRSKIFFGTNTGPYVCAMSLRKPSFLINIIPFLGTHSYHKIIDWHLPILIRNKKTNNFLTLKEIITNNLYLCDDKDIVERGCFFERIPEYIVANSFKEFLLAFKFGLHSYKPTSLQKKVRDNLMSNTKLGQVPYFPHFYLKELNFIYAI